MPNQMTSAFVLMQLGLYNPDFFYIFQII